jgi:hypothetical protein
MWDFEQLAFIGRGQNFMANAVGGSTKVRFLHHPSINIFSLGQSNSWHRLNIDNDYVEKMGPLKKEHALTMLHRNI